MFGWIKKHVVLLRVKNKVGIIEPKSNIRKLVNEDSNDWRSELLKEIQIKESEERFKSLFESSPNAIILTDENGDIHLINCQAESLFGYKRNEIINKKIEMLLPDMYHEKHILHREEFSKHAETRPMGIRLDLYGIHKNGTEIPVEIGLTPIKVKDKINILCTIVNITERKKAEAEILQKNTELIIADADKNRFISILVHDLRSPLSSLVGFLNILSKNIENYDKKKIEELINTMHSSAQNTFILLEELIMWILSKSGKLHPEYVKINFYDICLEIIELFNSISTVKNISITNVVSKHIFLTADINMLKTILRNLISNAIKFTNQGGQIDINASQSNSLTIISISDNGVGISSETKDKLFDNTKTLTTVGTDNESGTGLGLLLCKDFVEKHWGKIWVESQPGLGSNFKFTIPDIQ